MATRTFTQNRDGRWIEQTGPARFIQDADDGLLRGRLGRGESLSESERRKNWSAKRDETNVRRVRKNFSVVRPSNGRRGTVRHYKRGQIIGRI